MLWLITTTILFKLFFNYFIMTNPPLEEISEEDVTKAVILLAVSSYIRNHIREVRKEGTTCSAIAMLREDFLSPPLEECYKRFKELPEGHNLKKMFRDVEAEVDKEYSLLPEKTRQLPYRALHDFLDQNFLG
jgi:hypothetical protein